MLNGTIFQGIQARYVEGLERRSDSPLDLWVNSTEVVSLSPNLLDLSDFRTATVTIRIEAQFLLHASRILERTQIFPRFDTFW